MNVEEILNSKGSGVFTVSPTASIDEAVKILGSQNIGSVVVKDAADHVVGILSERDVVRSLQLNGVNALSGKVSEVMTANPFVCSLAQSVDDLMTEMTNKRIRHMPVVENGALVGMVSIGDVVKRKIEQTEREAKVLKDYIAS